MGNVARVEAESRAELLIDIAQRDMDVPLSRRGEQQAAALGRWLAGRSRGDIVVISSPYVRAAHTAELAVDAAGLGTEVVLDERLREREFGVLDRLTRQGIEQQFPDQAELRTRVGKFYYRPPGGESWCDVALRVRSVLDTLGREYPKRTVLVVTHEVVILMFRYVLERLGEAEVLAIGREQELANCSVTSFAAERARRGGMRLESFNEVAALVDEDAPVTTEPDVPLAPR
jgi:broad specificity phosphatase PhoE